MHKGIDVDTTLFLAAWVRLGARQKQTYGNLEAKSSLRS